jgi:hypothetical protein
MINSLQTIGDNSQPILTPPVTYHGMYTTNATNGFDGMYIVPRHATNIYYDSQTPDIEMLQYNWRYVSPSPYSNDDDLIASSGTYLTGDTTSHSTR